MSELLAEPLFKLVNTEIEQALLGACLLNNRAYEKASEFVAPEDFGNAVHGRIFEAIGKLIERGQVADPATLKTVFEQDDAIAAIGGTKYLAQLAASAVTVINAPHYAGTISDLSRRRRLVEACNDAIADAATVDLDRPSGAVIEEHEQRVFDLAERRSERGPVSLSIALRGAMQAAEEAYKRGSALSGVTTGLSELDRLLGGLMPGNLEILAGRPSMGKTSLAVGMAFSAARNGTPAVIFSMEETCEQISQRMLAMMADVGADRQRKGELDDTHWAKLIQAQRDLDRLPITIDDTPNLSVAQMAQRARRLKRQKGIGLVIIDHLQLARASGKPENRRLEVGSITRGLKTLAKDLSIPVLLLSQLSRATESRENKRPVLSDLRETGDIEQDADRVMFVFRQEYYLAREEPMKQANEDETKFNDRVERWQRDLDQWSGLGEIIVSKNRHGPVNSVRVAWDASRTLFSNLYRG